MMMLFKPTSLILLFAGLAMLAAQDARAAEKSTESPAETAPSVAAADPAIKPASPDEAALFDRSLKRWEALRKLDMDALYKYATPAYRKARDKTHLSLQYAGQIERLAAKVFSVKYLNAEKTSAELKLEFGYRSRTAVPGQIFESIAWTDQTWIKEDGEWWYVEPK